MSRQLRLTIVLTIVFAAAIPIHAQPWERQVYSIPIEDGAGSYEHPLVGGLNTPTIDFGDVDADGDLDLFIQDISDELIFFENLGSNEFEFRSSRFLDLSVASWFSVVDINADGYADILADQPSNAIRLYLNDGNAGITSFSRVADTLRDINGSTVSPDLASRPAIYDFDCDDKLDLFMGRQDGTITRYEVETIDSLGVPTFAFVEDRFQDIQIIGGPGKTGRGSAHGANALAVGDLNNDQIPDLIWGDFFEPSLVQFENIGSCVNFDLERISDTLTTNNAGLFLTGGLNTPVLVDYDGDQDDDLFAGVLSNQARDAVANLYHFERTTTGYDLQTDRFVHTFDVGKKSKPAFADLDGDLDLDLLIGNDITTEGNAGSITFLENTGTSQQPEFAVRDSSYFMVNHGFGLAPTLGDLDDDGDNDLLVGSFSGLVAFYRNEGTPDSASFSLQTLDILGDDVGSASTPVLVDLDSDGDLDLAVGESSGAMNYYENTGTPSSAVFTGGNLFAGIDVGQRSTVTFFDLDQDGDLDAAIGSQRSGVATYENIGSATSPSFQLADTLELYFPREAAPASADIDNDGDTDILFGLDGGGLMLYRNLRLGTSSETITARASVLLTAYPNPARHTLTIEALGLSVGPARISMFDLLGREVLRSEFDSSFLHRLQVDISHLPAGRYFVKIKQDGTLLPPSASFTKS